MSEIQQQIADGARPLARVDDVIAHGHAIPANVLALRDTAGDIWTDSNVAQCLLSSLRDEHYNPPRRWYPMTVVEVDPEPQPVPLPAGNIVVSSADLAMVLNQRVSHSHLKPGVWDDDNAPELAGRPCKECAARARLEATLPPPREPRTWPKIEAAPDDLPRALDLSSHPSGSYPVRWVLDSSHELSGMYVGPLGNHHTLPELRAVGWVTEVLT